MKKILLLLLVIFTLSFAFTSCGKEKKETTTTKSTTETYQCPMDCEHGKTYNKKGSCPVCKMELKPVTGKTEDHSGHNH